MLARRPFRDDDRLLAAAREVWFALDETDWREAFGHHPTIGDGAALRERFPQTAALSEQEQSGVAGASDAVLDALAAGNRAYHERFGYIFIVCASGKSAEEMLALLHARLPNPPETESEPETSTPSFTKWQADEPFDGHTASGTRRLRCCPLDTRRRTMRSIG